MELAGRLEKCDDFGSIFNLVKESVKKVLNKDRAGLMLALQNLPQMVGAYYPVGSNFIVMNKNLLERVMFSHDKKTANSYIFYVLLHEYLHSLGYLDEKLVLRLSHQICTAVLGERHEATRIAERGIGSLFENSFYVPGEQRAGFEIIDNFDTENMNYIG